MTLQDIKSSVHIRGTRPNEDQGVSVIPFEDEAIDLFYHKNGRTLSHPFHQFFYAETTDEFSWKFDANTVKVRLTSESYRIKLVHLFAPYLARAGTTA